MAAVNVPVQYKDAMQQELQNEIKNPSLPYKLAKLAVSPPLEASLHLNGISHNMINFIELLFELEPQAELMLEGEERVSMLSFAAPIPLCGEEANPQQEYLKYLKFCITFRPEQNFDVLKFWSENEQHWPHLAEMVKFRLSAPASSSPSERTFSIAKQVISDRRNRLAPATVAICMVVRAS